MSERNRVTPLGDVVAVPLRGAWIGNRGVIHDGTPECHDIVRSHTTTAWIICALDVGGAVAPRWEPGRWTALFFQDEAVALAAGHRPCARCRGVAFTGYRDAVRAGTGDGSLRAPDLDRRLHAERRDRATGRRRLHRLAWPAVPASAFVLLDDRPWLVLADGLVQWTTEGYGERRHRPTVGRVDVVTPETSVVALRAGYHPQLDPGSRPGAPAPAAGVRSGSGQGVPH